LKRPQEIRTAPRDWVTLLRIAYRFLREQEVGDLLLYGSQAMSLYMRSPLRSKDLDLLSSQTSLARMEALAEKLAEIEHVEYRTTTVQTRRFDDRKMVTYAIELRVSSRPFFVELFDSILDARPLSILQPYIESIERWGFEIWSTNREATLALRLAFRQPEGISRLNATRMNSFIRENLRSLDFAYVASILKDWGVEDWVERNLVQLYRRNRLRIINDYLIMPEIERKMKKDINNHSEKRQRYSRF